MSAPVIERLLACAVRAREFRDVAGYEGHYSVTDDGRVWSNEHHWVTGHHGKIRRHRGAGWARQYETRAGYRVVHLKRGGHVRTISVHRLVAAAFLPNAEGLPHVNHSNLRRADNRARNLEWCSAAENKQHSASARRRYGRFAFLPLALPAANDR